MAKVPLFVIPARGGSKGIPRKNIKLLGGKPLIAYTIQTAYKAAEPGSHIILSTEDEEIAEVGRSLGLDVSYMRPISLATDTTGSREVILDVMDWADKQNFKYDCVVLLQPTSPFRSVQDIKDALSLYNENIDMVVSVKESDANPYYNLFETDCDGFLHISKGTGKLARRQDAPRVWEYNGAVYVINPQSIKNMELGEFTRRVPYIMPAEKSIDLDTNIDWLLAEQLIKNSIV